MQAPWILTSIWLAAAAMIGLASVIGQALAVDGVVAAESGAKSPEKYPSEPETRAVMEAIRQRIINVHTLITHRRMPVASAKQFAHDVNADVERIEKQRASAGAAPKPDPITPILQKITSGAAIIAQPSPERNQIDGLVDVVSALEQYAAIFDHPGWRSLRQQ